MIHTPIKGIMSSSFSTPREVLLKALVKMEKLTSDELEARIREIAKSTLLRNREILFSHAMGIVTITISARNGGKYFISADSVWKHNGFHSFPLLRYWQDHPLFDQYQELIAEYLDIAQNLFAVGQIIVKV